MGPAAANTSHRQPGLVDRLRRAGGLRRSDWVWGYLFLSINFLGFAIFSLGPIIASLALSFMGWRLLQPPQFTGLTNLNQLVGDGMFFQTLLNTAYFVVGYVPLVTVLSFLLAVLLNRPLRGIGLLRGIYFLPSITLLVSVAMVWHWLLDPQAGMLNFALHVIGLPSPQWLADAHWAMPTIIMVAVWQDVGYFAVVYLAGLQSVPSALYEAADIDGANAWQKLTQITVPLMIPTAFFVLVISLINGWQVFALPFLMTQGGPANSTYTLLLYVYNQAFTSLHMGYASLMSWVLFLIILVVTLVQWRFAKRGENVFS